MKILHIKTGEKWQHWKNGGGNLRALIIHIHKKLITGKNLEATFPESWILVKNLQPAESLRKKVLWEESTMAFEMAHPPPTSHLPCWWQLLRSQSTCMEQVASARRSHLGSSLKELWLCVWSGLVGPSRTGIRACFVSSDLKFSQSWSDFLGSFCQKHMKASTSCRRLQQGITVRTRNKQTSQEKAYKGKMGGKDMWRITYFKSSFLYWGMEKSMCISMAECMFRKDMSGP